MQVISKPPLKRMFMALMLVTITYLILGCASTSGLDGKIVCDTKAKAYVVSTYGPLAFNERLPDADQRCRDLAGRKEPGQP